MLSLLQPVKRSETAFISALSCGPVPVLDGLHMAEIRFELSHFSERLPEVYAIPLPAHLNQAVKKRRAEYLASRYAARILLQGFGVEDFLLRNDEDRTPVWPSGIRGSLTHRQQRAVVIVAKRSDILPGVDVEQVIKAETAESISRTLISQDEQELLLQSALPFADALTLAFSLKESLYKALFPRLRQFMDFHSAELTALNPLTGEAEMRLTRSLHADFPAGRLFNGHFVQYHNEITTLVVAHER